MDGRSSVAQIKLEMTSLSEECDDVCPISMCPMTDPVFTADGQKYDRASIETWFRAGLELKHLDLVDAVAVDVVDHNMSGYHRAGWARAVALLKLCFRAPANAFDETVALDTFVDRTFLSGKTHARPWIGFVHHTFDESHSEHNCSEMFRSPAFVRSLSAYKGLIVMSNAMKIRIATKLVEIHLAELRVHFVRHPMDVVIGKEFTVAKFLENPDKKVVHVGAWLRNPWSIYELPVQERWNNPHRIRKAALRGRDMDAYFKPDGFARSLREHLHRHSGRSTGIQWPACRPGPVVNLYSSYMHDSIMAKDSSVRVIERLTDAEYDDLLDKNVVFLDMVDCSAANTALECLVRNTPLFVNRLPALEEVFGTDYPGFYENLVDASLMVVDVAKIARVHEHLAGLDKYPYASDVFVAAVRTIVEDALRR